MKKILNIYKPQGITPFQLIQQLKKDSDYQDQKIGFAGRLDPLAHGVMVLLVGEENKNRDQYLGLGKEYEFVVLFGVETDSFDYLGLLKNGYRVVPHNLTEQLQNFIKRYTGEVILEYPPFSSKTINGIPLFKLAKRNRLGGVELPKRLVKIEAFDLLEVETISAEDIEKEILAYLKKIKGFFRQQKIIAGWIEFFKHNQHPEFHMARFRISCSTGTYVRRLASLMGEELGCGAIAFEILRTKVGEYTLVDSIKLKD